MDGTEGDRWIFRTFVFDCCCHCLLNKAVFRVPFSRIYWLELTFSHYHIFLRYVRKLLLMEAGAFGDAALERIRGQEMNHSCLFTLMLFGFLTGALALKVHNICLICPEKTWSEFYLLVWLGSGFTVVVVLISLSLKDLTSCLAILVLINWCSGCLFIFSVQIELL